MSNVIKRQTEDLLISDLLPVEKPHYFTNTYFYNYILKKGFDIPSYHNSTDDKSIEMTYPLNYLVRNKKTFRKIGIINPIGMIYTLEFMKEYQHDLLSMISDLESFSIRKPIYNNQLFYIKSSKDTTYYKNQIKQFLISLESSGIYFNHFKFKRLDKYLKSFKYENQIEKYNFQSTLDIQDFFGSIYTHSYKWLISNDFVESKKINQNSSNTLLPTIDNHLQKINGGKTRGIIVGPEFSRICAELLMVYLDNKIIRELDLKMYKDYEVSRFVDDYYIYYNKKEDFEKIKKSISGLLSEYHFLLKEEKEQTIARKDNFNEWREDVKHSVDILEKVLEGKIRFSVLKDIIKKNATMYGEKVVTSYLLSSIVSIVENVYKNKPKSNNEYTVKQIGKDKKLGNVYIKVKNSNFVDSLLNFQQKSSIIRVVFLLLSIHVNYINIDKVIRILDLILKDASKKDYDYFNNVKDEMLDVYSEIILSNYVIDWINLYVFISNKGIDIKPYFLDLIYFKINGEEKNLLGFPGLLMIYESYGYKFPKVKQEINSYIKNELQKTDPQDIYKKEGCWILYIFNKSPYISVAAQKAIDRVIDGVIKINDKNSEVELVMKF